MSISLDQPTWLADLIQYTLEHYDAEAAAARASQLPVDERRGVAAISMALDARNISQGLPALYPEMSEDPEDFPSYKFLSTLRIQAEVALDVAIALGRPIEGEMSRLALLMIWWACLGELDQADALAQLWRQVSTGEREVTEFSDYLDSHVEPLGAHLKSRAVLKADPLLALPINQGISFFDIRMAGQLAEALHDDERLERHEIERVMTLTHSDRLRFVEATIALAWSNGLLEAEERNLIKKQIEMLQLDKKQSRKLLNAMITPATPKEFIQSFSDQEVAMFVLRQLVIASMIDGEQDAKERKFLQRTAKEMGLNDTQFRQIMETMMAFLESNRDSIDAMKKQKKRTRPGF
ncbi:MAG: DUF533 domain-containing protein [Myxococcales bacterium]|nr:DUF533 domain-containing protein [Myxococcales bacterium]MCB9642752.1 DUF533 domain-containing protein [Myxococcales bacterium]